MIWWRRWSLRRRVADLEARVVVLEAGQPRIVQVSGLQNQSGSPKGAGDTPGMICRTMAF